LEKWKWYIKEMKILKISWENFKGIVGKTVSSIKKGEVVVCPTDTIYGLIADATSGVAIKKVLEIKKRTKQKPIPIFIRDIKTAKRLAKINKTQEKFLTRIWPGEVTAVLKRRKSCKLPEILFGKKKTIGLRIPKHELIIVLLKKINRPLTGTSANISGKPGSTKIKEVLSQFRNQKIQPDLIVDAGDLKPSKPSAVIDLTKSKPKLLRIGELPKEELLKNLK